MSSILLILSIIIINIIQLSSYNLGSKSPYYSQFVNDTPVPLTCSIYYLQSVNRHGLRYPTLSGSKKNTAQLITVLKAKSQFITNTTYDWMKTYTKSYPASVVETITPTGAQELYELGQRMVQRFPSAFPAYTETGYAVHNTAISRTGTSATAFMRAITVNNPYGPYHWAYSDTPAYDNTLRFFENCPGYGTYLNVNNTASIKAEEWAAKYFPTIAQSIQDRLGVGSNWVIDIATVKSMQVQCTYDYSIENDTRWCDLFTPEELANLSFYDDIQTWFASGYGNPYSAMATVLLNDIITRMNNSITSTTEKVRIRYAHAETVLPLFTILGLYEDSFKIDANISDTDRKARKWDTNKIAIYGTNVFFILYKCSASYVVRTLVNEQEVVIPGCGDVYCPLDTFISVLQPKIYDFATYCI